MSLQDPVLFCDYLQPGEDAAAAADRIHWSLPCAKSDPALVRSAAPSPYDLCLFGHHVNCCRRCPRCHVMGSGNLIALDAYIVTQLVSHKHLLWAMLLESSVEPDNRQGFELAGTFCPLKCLPAHHAQDQPASQRAFQRCVAGSYLTWSSRVTVCGQPDVPSDIGRPIGAGDCLREPCSDPHKSCQQDPCRRIIGDRASELKHRVEHYSCSNCRLGNWARHVLSPD